MPLLKPLLTSPTKFPFSISLWWLFYFSLWVRFMNPPLELPYYPVSPGLWIVNFYFSKIFLWYKILSANMNFCYKNLYLECKFTSREARYCNSKLMFSYISHNVLVITLSHPSLKRGLFKKDEHENWMIYYLYNEIKYHHFQSICLSLKDKFWKHWNWNWEPIFKNNIQNGSLWIYQERWLAAKAMGTSTLLLSYI